VILLLKLKNGSGPRRKKGRSHIKGGLRSNRDNGLKRGGLRGRFFFTNLLGEGDGEKDAAS